MPPCRLDAPPQSPTSRRFPTTQAPQGQEYIWTLIRGVPVKAGGDPQESTCYVTDGSCRICQFPMTQGKVQERVAADGSPSHSISCAVCGMVRVRVRVRVSY